MAWPVKLMFGRHEDESWDPQNHQAVTAYNLRTEEAEMGAPGKS